MFCKAHFPFLRKKLVSKKSIAEPIGHDSEEYQVGKKIKPEKIDISNNSEKEVQEIEIIADEVYKLIEKKIEIEKDRRGLF